jgi:hypothetical protein
MKEASGQILQRCALQDDKGGRLRMTKEVKARPFAKAAQGDKRWPVQDDKNESRPDPSALRASG